MKKYDDAEYIGKKIGKLTITGLSDKPGYWVCKCECGKEKEIRKYSVLSGATSSCGCSQKEAVRKANEKPILEGTRYGKLVVIGKNTETEKRGIFYDLLCDCGGKITVKATDLRAGRYSSCGKCVRNTIIGKRFGKLLVISEAYRDRGTIYYNCDCDCGNKTVVELSKLRSGWTQSCGCLRGENLSLLNKKYNDYEFADGNGIGILPNGERFYFDIEDYEKIKDIYWSTSQYGYVRGHSYDGANVFIHRIIMEPPSSMYVDHIDHNLLDNRKSNLRICTPAQSCWNTRTPITNKTGRKGVFYDDINRRWVVSFVTSGEEYIAYFDTREEAMDHRVEKDIELRGEYSIYLSAAEDKWNERV